MDCTKIIEAIESDFRMRDAVDSMVHQAKSLEATKVNTSGAIYQIIYLIQAGVLKDDVNENLRLIKRNAGV